MTYPTGKVKYPFAMFWDTVEQKFEYDTILESKPKKNQDKRTFTRHKRIIGITESGVVIK